MTFVVRSVLLVVLTFFAILLLVPEHDATRSSEYWESAGAIAGLLVYAVWLIYAVIPRCRDMGLPWWTGFGMLLPVLNLIFLGALVIMKKDSNDEPNQPPQRNAGSRPSSGDSPASATPSSLGPRGCYEKTVVKREARGGC